MQLGLKIVMIIFRTHFKTDFVHWRKVANQFEPPILIFNLVMSKTLKPFQLP